MIVDKPGWPEDTFVLGDHTFGGSAGKRIMQRPNPESLLRIRGILQEWIAGVGTHANGNHRLQLAMSLWFAATLIHLVDAESGLFHMKA